MRTSGNYGDNGERKTGGANGLGAKLVAIFSDKFTIETIYRNKEGKLTYYR